MTASATSCGGRRRLAAGRAVQSGSGASHVGWHAHAVGPGMLLRQAFGMAAPRLAMAGHARIATFLGMHPPGFAGSRLSLTTGGAAARVAACGGR
jgi:hypothetical protein